MISQYFKRFAWVAARLLHIERTQKDSNLRPSLFVVLIRTFLDVRWCLESRLSKLHWSSRVRRCLLRFSFYCCHSVVEVQFCCSPSARFRRSPHSLHGSAFMAGCSYSPRCREGVFPETGLPIN